MTLSSSGGNDEFQSAKASAAPLLLLHGAGFYPFTWIIQQLHKGRSILVSQLESFSSGLISKLERTKSASGCASECVCVCVFIISIWRVLSAK